MQNKLSIDAKLGSQNKITGALKNSSGKLTEGALENHGRNGIETIVSGAPSPFRVSARRVPTHGEIANQAEALWREKGCPLARDNEIWLEAERQLHRLPDPERGDSNANFNSDEVMGELDNLFPSRGGGRETTSL